MTRASQTELAVLAALSIAPQTGYALRESIRDDLGLFWSESFGQIYPALTRLAGEGLLAQEEGDRPGSSVYRLRPSGRRRLLELLREPAVATPPRNGLLMRLFFGDVLGAEECRMLVLAARERALAQLAELSVARAEAEAEPVSTPQRPYWLITISAGEHAAAAAVGWADESLAVLDAL